jgi:predicted Rossmann fold nucleotide-binding protein DprA/Smf involved in DNA uptake
MTPKSDDSLAVLLICSRLGLPGDGDPKPLTLGEWNRLAQRLHDADGAPPGALLGRSAAEIEGEFGLAQPEAERLARLLDRGTLLAIELERLDSLGIWALTRVDEGYPQRLKKALGQSVPPVLFGCGERALFDRPGLAIVGSRDASERALAVASAVGAACAESGLSVVSGAARGVDLTAMNAAIAQGGTAVGVLADNLQRKIRDAAVRAHVEQGDALLVTPYPPDAGFSVGAAMGRNKLIYALADYALVVTSDAEKGGTWAGAVEAIRAGWVPVFAVDAEGFSEGTRLLIGRGATAFPERLPCEPSALLDWFTGQASSRLPAEAPVQRNLFS